MRHPSINLRLVVGRCGMTFVTGSLVFGGMTLLHNETGLVDSTPGDPVQYPENQPTISRETDGEDLIPGDLLPEYRYFCLTVFICLITGLVCSDCGVFFIMMCPFLPATCCLVARHRRIKPVTGLPNLSWDGRDISCPRCCLYMARSRRKICQPRLPSKYAATALCYSADVADGSFITCVPLRPRFIAGCLLICLIVHCTVLQRSHIVQYMSMFDNKNFQLSRRPPPSATSPPGLR